MRWTLLFLFANLAHAAPSPAPADVTPTEFEGSVPAYTGASRGAYAGLVFGTLLFDNGPSPTEETAWGEVRRWVYQAAGGTMTIGPTTYATSCIRVTRHNVITPSLSFYYEVRLSALEGGCTSGEANRPVEFIFTLDDFVINAYRSSTLRYYGQQTEMLLFPADLRQPERIDAVVAEGSWYVGGRLASVPPVSGLALEVMVRKAGETSCRKPGFDPDTHAYSSYITRIDAGGKWGVTVPKTGGAVCLRLVGGGWTSAVTSVRLP